MSDQEHYAQARLLLGSRRIGVPRGTRQDSSLLLEALVHACLAIAQNLGFPGEIDVDLADPAADLRAEQASDARRDQHDEDGAR